MLKNVAGQKVTLLAIDVSTNSPKTGDAANLTAYVNKDDAGVTILSDTSAAEIDATNALGLYSFDLDQAETNADKLLFSATSTTANIRIVPLLIQTVPNGFGNLVIYSGFVAGSGAIQSGTIASLTSQTQWTLSAGSPDADAYNGCIVVVTNASDSTKKCVGVVLDYAVTTKKVTLLNDPAVFTMAVGDTFAIYPDRSLKPTIDNRTFDVAATGEGGLDFDNILSSTVATISGLTVTNTITIGDGMVVNGGLQLDALSVIGAAQFFAAVLAINTDNDIRGITVTPDIYHADIAFTRDQTNTTDEYSATWYKNGVRKTAGITVPTIQVVKRADGTDLIASTAMTQIGTTGSYKYDATGAARTTVGEAVLAIVSATIDAATRSFSKIITRDS